MNKQNRIINRIALNYLKHAHIQRISAQKIYEHLQKYTKNTINNRNNLNSIILDLGSGPGTLSHITNMPDHQLMLPQSTTMVLCDFNINMLKTIQNDNTNKAQNSNYLNIAINADAHSLPFCDSSVDIIISNLMIQWSPDKGSILSEIKRILKPNGQFICTTLISNSLWQLQHNWSKALGNNTARTLQFEDLNHYTQLCKQNNLQILHSEAWEHMLYFDSTMDLMRHFKNTGTNMAQPKNSGLGGKNKLELFKKAYETTRTPDGLPLSYHFGLLVLGTI